MSDLIERLRARVTHEKTIPSMGHNAADRERAELIALLTEAAAALRQAAVPAGEAVAWMHGVCADDGEEDQALSFSPDNFPLEGVAGYRKVWCRPLIYGDTHPPAAEVRASMTIRSCFGQTKREMSSGCCCINWRK